jgi:hypothetical protein
MQYNPAIVAASQEVDIADANTRLQRSARIPTLDLVERNKGALDLTLAAVKKLL